MKAHQLGLIEPEDRREMSHQMVKELLSCSCCEEFKLAVQALWQIWQALDEQIKQLTLQLKQQAHSDPDEAPIGLRLELCAIYLTKSHDRDLG